MILEDIVERLAYARPGYTLAAFQQAALPVFGITAKVFTLDAKPLSPLEEGCLRAIDAGLSSRQDIFEFLGLPPKVLSSTLAGLNTREFLSYLRTSKDSAAAVSLTERGRTVLSASRAIEPQERLVRFTYDPFLRRVVFLPIEALYRPREVRELGLRELPLCGLRRPEAADIPLEDIDRVIRRNPTMQREVRELLTIRRLERREMLFLPVVVLFYRADDRDEVQVAIVREDGFSYAHEAAFRDLGGPAALGANLLSRPRALEAAKAVLPPDAVDAIPEVDKLLKAIAAAEAESAKPSASSEVHSAVRAVAEEARARLAQMTQRPLRTHEHPALLRQALTGSSERLLLISPWINHHVVDTGFVSSLTKLLRSGCKVYIGYGIGNDEGHRGDKAQQKPPITDKARLELERLVKEFENFVLKFIGNTHRKVLVSDSRFAVVTSLNWLSFKGDPKMKPRDEFGFLVTDPEALEKVFQDTIDLIQSGYDHPKVSSDTPNRKATRRPSARQ